MNQSHTTVHFEALKPYKSLDPCQYELAMDLVEEDHNQLPVKF